MQKAAVRIVLRRGTALQLVVAVASVVGSGMPVAAAERLTIGSKAPSIEVEEWLTDKPPITDFEKGKVYVVEFWATWCGPCVASIPHLKELQERHEKEVTVISISDESREKIEDFLEREHGGTTFGEITTHYWLATDPDGSVRRDYMEAAEQRGIPTAFVVGKTGEIEWIGHPMQSDAPVAEIVAGTWDREAFARERKAEQELLAQMRVVSQFVQRKQFTEALAEIDKLLPAATSPRALQRLEMARRRIKLEADAHASREAAGQSVDLRRLAIGDQVTTPVTGRANGGIWGDAVYTLDSDPGVAAVHAGLVAIGETKTIKVWVVPSPGRFTAANRHGVQSRPWGPYHAAFFMQPAPSTPGP